MLHDERSPILACDRGVPPTLLLSIFPMAITVIGDIETLQFDAARSAR